METEKLKELLNPSCSSKWRDVKRTAISVKKRFLIGFTYS